jgi:hypothetical protein
MCFHYPGRLDSDVDHGGVQDRGKRVYGSAWVVLGEPQCGHGGADLRALAFVLVQPGQDSFGEGGFAEFGIGEQHESSHRSDQSVRCDKRAGKPVAGPEIGKCVGVMTAGHREQAAGVVKAYPVGGVGISPHRLPRAVKPRSGLGQPSLAR